jgi:hypothetical protein
MSDRFRLDGMKLAATAFLLRWTAAAPAAKVTVRIDNFTCNNTG